MISETCEKLGIPFSHTTKLFYGDMVASLTVKLPFNEPKQKSFKNLLNYHKKLMQFRKDRTSFMLEILGDHDWDFKINRASISFYFAIKDDLNQIVNDLVTKGHVVTRVVAPRNEDNVKYLVKNSSKVIRETKFRGKYRFRIELKRSYVNQDTITTLLHSMFGGEFSVVDDIWSTPSLKISDERAYYNNNQILYVAELEDVFLTRISINEFIYRIEEVVSEEVVLKDLSNEGSIAEEAY